MALDAVSEARLGDVHPVLAAKIRKMAEMLEQAHIIIRVTQGLRTWGEQAKLYAQGRTTPGQIVTKAPPGHSWHNMGLACDVCPMVNGQPDWNAPYIPTWKKIVEVGVSLGLEAGALWTSFPDLPHFQLTGKLPVSPDDEVRQTFAEAGMEGVWKETGIDA